MARRQPLGQALRREARAVVLDERARAWPRPRPAPTRTCVGLRVLGDVGQELAGGRERELLLRVAAGGSAGRGAGRGASASPPAGRSSAARRRARPAPARTGAGRRPPRAAARRSGPAPSSARASAGWGSTSPASCRSWRAESRFWMAWSCSASASARRSRCSGLERVGEQGGALLGQPLHGRRAAGQQQREQDAADADPGQVAGLREDEARRVGLAGGRVEGGLQDVRRRRHHGRGDGDREAEAEGDRDGHEEQREPGVRVGAAGEERQHADGRDVDGRRQQREARSDTARTCTHASTAALQAENSVSVTQEAGLVRVRVLQPLAEGDQRDGREAQPGDDALGLGQRPRRSSAGNGRPLHAPTRSGRAASRSRPPRRDRRRRASRRGAARAS